MSTVLSPAAAELPASPAAATPAADPRSRDSHAASRLFEIDCELHYEVRAETDFLFQIEASQTDQQTILSEAFIVSPALRIRHGAHPGSTNRFARVHAMPGPLAVRYRARVRLDTPEPDPDLGELPVAGLPDEVLHHLVPTRYCESDLLGRTALRTFGHIEPGLKRVEAITQWIREHIQYEIGSSDATTTARDTLANRAGVCRDFAHVGIAFCRALNIPARLVVGYVKFEEPPPDFHAIFEAYLGDPADPSRGRWVLFDPTGLAPVDRLVRIGTGGDAKDVAFCTIFGQAVMGSMRPEIEEVLPPR